MKKMVVLAVLILLGSFFIGCGTPPPDTTTPEGKECLKLDSQFLGVYEKGKDGVKAIIVLRDNHAIVYYDEGGKREFKDNYPPAICLQWPE